MSQFKHGEPKQQQQASTDVQTAVGQVTPPLQLSIHTYYEDRQSMAVGVILIVVGFLSIAVASSGIYLYNIFSFLAHLIWFGVVVSRTPRITYLPLCSLAGFYRPSNRPR